MDLTGEHADQHLEHDVQAVPIAAADLGNLGLACLNLGGMRKAIEYLTRRGQLPATSVSAGAKALTSPIFHQPMRN